MRTQKLAMILALCTSNAGWLSSASAAPRTTGSTKPAMSAIATTNVASAKLARVDHFAHLGGMADPKAAINRSVLGSLFHPEAFRALGEEPPTGVLISGPRLTGKTALAEATRQAIKAKGGVMLGVDAHSIGKPEQIADLFAEAVKLASGKGADGVEVNGGKKHEVAIFIDEIHKLGGDSGRTALVAELRQQMVELQETLASNPKMKRVVLIGATDQPKLIDSSITRKGFMEVPIEVKMPDEKETHEILTAVTSKHRIGSDVDFKIMAKDKLRGWAGGDIAKLAKTAVFSAVERETPGADMDRLEESALRKITITKADFEHAGKTVKPAGLQGIEVNNNRPVHFEDVVGATKAKAELKRVARIIHNPEAAKEMGVELPRGVVMYGPPGNGKTMLARAMATDAGMTFIEIKPTVRGGVVGESENNLQSQINAAKQHAPCIVFIDEADSLFAARGSHPGDPVHDTMVNMMLQNADGVEKLQGVVFVLATNRLESLDSAIVSQAGQGGRFRSVHVGQPETQDREQILANGLKKTKVASSVDVKALAKSTEGWSGRGTGDLVDIAIRNAFDRDAKAVEMSDFKKALEDVGAKSAEQVEVATPAHSGGLHVRR